MKVNAQVTRGGEILLNSAGALCSAFWFQSMDAPILHSALLSSVVRCEGRGHGKLSWCNLCKSWAGQWKWNLKPRLQRWGPKGCEVMLNSDFSATDVPILHTALLSSIVRCEGRVHGKLSWCNLCKSWAGQWKWNESKSSATYWLKSSLKSAQGNYTSDHFN